MDGPRGLIDWPLVLSLFIQVDSPCLLVVVIVCKFGSSSPPYCTVIRSLRSKVTLKRRRGPEFTFRLQIGATDCILGHDFTSAFRNFVCIRSEILHGEKQDFGLLANRSTLTVREFLAAALGLAGVSSSSDRTCDATRLQLGSATIEIEISLGPGGFDLPREAIIAWVSKAAHAVAHYYGLLPVLFTRVRVNSLRNAEWRVRWRNLGKRPTVYSYLRGRHTTRQQLHEDRLMTHEFIHTAFPDVAGAHHWIGEGIATYVEPIARVQIGDLTPDRIWTDMLREMPKGEPQALDKGLDHTHTWGRIARTGEESCTV